MIIRLLVLAVKLPGDLQSAKGSLKWFIHI